MTLCEAPVGQKVVVEGLNFRGKKLLRVMDMGIVVGVKLRVTGAAPLGDPIIAAFDDMEIALRKAEAGKITVRPA
jgi:ferrous iron transport protein A